MNRNIETRMEITPHYEITSFNPEIDELTKLNEIVESSYQKNRNFFEHDIDGIKINFVYSDEELTKAVKEAGLEFQDWHKAVAYSNGLWLFSPKLPKGFDCANIMTHEMAHIFTNKLFYEGNPAWLREGLANVVTERFIDNKFKSNIKFKEAHNGLQFQEHPIYDKSTVFTRYLIDEFGKDKLFLLLTVATDKMKERNDYQNFCDLFEQVYNNEFEIIENEFMEKRTID